MASVTSIWPIVAIASITVVPLVLAAQPSIATRPRKAAQPKPEKERTWFDDTSAPRFSALPAHGENGSLSMECEGEKPYREIHCRFHAVTVLGPKESTLEKDREELRQEIERRPEAAIEIQRKVQKACAEVRAGFGAIAEDAGTIEKTLAARRESAAWDLACDSCPPACSFDSFITKLDPVNRPCRIWTQSFELALKREGLDRWVFAGTAGLCGNTLIVDLYRDREVLWTFRQRRIKNPTPASDLCAVQDSDLTYSWRASKKADFSKLCPDGLYEFGF